MERESVAQHSRQVIEGLHARKSEMFVEHIAAEAGKGFVLRPGVKALLEAQKVRSVLESLSP